MTIGWRQFAARFKQGGLALLWAFIYDPLTARIVNFYRHPKLWRRRLLLTTVIASLILVVFVGGMPSFAHGILGYVASGFGYIISILAALLGLILSLLGWIFNGVVYNWPWFHQLVTFPAVETGWKAIRDVANLSFVLILLGIGFATILRVPTYHIKRLILPFVVALLLINFSKLICGVVLDFCRVLMTSFAQSMMASSNGGNYTGVIAKAIDIPTFWKFPKGKDMGGEEGWKYLQAVIAAFLFMLVLCFAFLMLIVMLISRWVSLMVLTIFSPLAYAGMILPTTQKMVKTWWTSFLQKAFYGPAAVFMVWLAMFVLMTISSQRNEVITGGDDAPILGLSISGAFNIGADTFLIMLIAVIILLKAVTISKSMGIAGANAVVGAGSSYGKKAGKKIISGMGRGAAGMAKGAAGMMGLRNAGAYMAGVRNKLWRGQQDAENAKRVKNEKEVSGSMAGRDEAQQKAIMSGKGLRAGGKGARGGASAAERVEAANQLMKDGKLKSKDDIAKAEDVVNRYGSKQKQAEFKDLVKGTNIGAAGLSEDDQATYIKRKGVDTQSDESLRDNAKVILKNANRGQVDKLNDQQKRAYAEGLKGIATGDSPDAIKAQREYARLKGGFTGLTGANIDQEKVLEGMSAKDLAKLDKGEVDSTALEKRVQGNLDDLTIINAENPQMAKEQRDAALARVQEIERTRGSSASGLLDAQGRPVGETNTISDADQRFIDDAKRVLGRPTTP